MSEKVGMGSFLYFNVKLNNLMKVKKKFSEVFTPSKHYFIIKFKPSIFIISFGIDKYGGNR